MHQSQSTRAHLQYGLRGLRKDQLHESSIRAAGSRKDALGADARRLRIDKGKAMEMKFAPLWDNFDDNQGSGMNTLPQVLVLDDL
eukprot:1149122-Pelagomonas_calceolata.AAC.1